MGERLYLNNDWGFVTEFDKKMLKAEYETDAMTNVRIPHTVKELPFHYFDEQDYQMLCGYRKVFEAKKEWKNKTLLLTFEGIAHESEVFLNGKKVAEHHCGYTAFTIDISSYVDFKKDNILVVKVDSNETINQPPFGYVIDYMTYGGIYRDVYLDVKSNSYIEDVFVKTKIAKDGEKSGTISDIKIHNVQNGQSLRQWFRKFGEEEYKLLENSINLECDSCTLTQDTKKVELWDTVNPNLYQIKTELLSDKGEVLDENVVRFGFRKAVFHKDGFYLNGKKFKIRGLNRHQSYAYTGYAMPKSMQVNDADILKNELGVNAVRTSHYPQSHYFIDRCDEIGLLVFTEIPGWQHIGDDNWKDQAVLNVKDMVLQYRNHTSIILWGVRINESVDDDEFYLRTNAVAHELDPTRQTGGVRCYKKGSLLEDVYTYNDFSHTGNNKGCEKKMAISPDDEKPYLVSEYNGHMFPCKTFDWEEKRAEHAIRHANVLESVAKTSGIAGSFGWCMFDYNTHKDFGSGDRICYHGVMDMFRNPKLAANVYAMQQDEIPVLAISSSMDIGEHPGCNRGDIYLFTNADSVKMYKNGFFLKEYKGSDSKFKHLAHGPIKIDDYIGDALHEGEDMSKAQADAVKDLLNEVARVGLYDLSKKMQLKAAGLIARYHMTMEDAVKLYNKYVGDWGASSTEYLFEAIKDGEVVKTLNVKPMTKMSLYAAADHTSLKEDNTYDVAAVRIKAVDENGNLLSFANDVVKLQVKGPVELIGPDIISLQGGFGGTYVRTIGKGGKAVLRLSTIQGEEFAIDFTID